MKGLLKNGADLLLDIERGFDSLNGANFRMFDINTDSYSTLFRLIEDGSLKGAPLEKMKILWNTKEDKKVLLDFLETQNKGLTGTIFDAKSGEWKIGSKEP